MLPPAYECLPRAMALCLNGIYIFLASPTFRTRRCVYLGRISEVHHNISMALVARRRLLQFAAAFLRMQRQPVRRYHDDSHIAQFHMSAAAAQVPDESPRDKRSRYIEANGVRFHYTQAGGGNNVVLMLPGAMGCSQTDFHYQLGTVNRDLFTLISLDPRGYGKTIPPERDWPLHFLERDAHDAARVMQNLDYKKFSVVGWSDGGITGMILAARYPQHVNRLLIWGSNAFLTKEDMKLYEAIRDVSTWSERMRKPYEDVYGHEYFQKHWSGWVDAFDAYMTQRDGDICKEDLKDIRCPTLIIHGEKDPLVVQSHADYLHENIQGSRLEKIPDGKHNVHMKFHHVFNSMAEKFLLEPTE